MQSVYAALLSLHYRAKLAHPQLADQTVVRRLSRVTDSGTFPLCGKFHFTMETLIFA
jgi:hypothetical protein